MANASILLGILGFGIFLSCGMPLLIPVALIIGFIAFIKGPARMKAAVGMGLCVLESLMVVELTDGMVNQQGWERTRARLDEARSHLRHDILPGEMAFQAQRTIVEDGGGDGSFAFLPELAVTSHAKNREPLLRDKAWLQQPPVINGYRYYVFLPDGAKGAGSRDALAGHDPVSRLNRSQHFVAYAWPIKQGDYHELSAYAITEQGVLHGMRMTFRDFEAPAPDWDRLFCNGWGSVPNERWKALP